MGLLQDLDDLEKWWEQPDPWRYDDNPDDVLRRGMVLSILPSKPFARVLDIGCGNGFVTKSLPGDKIWGVDISKNAIAHAKRGAPEHIVFQRGSLFELPAMFKGLTFDLIVITGVLYPQYIGDSELLVYDLVDSLLKQQGTLISCHIQEWCRARFPYLLVQDEMYPYREYVHVLERYFKI